MFTHRCTFPKYILFSRGAVAQLIERVVRNDEVASLILVCSTIISLEPIRLMSEER